MDELMVTRSFSDDKGNGRERDCTKTNQVIQVSSIIHELDKLEDLGELDEWMNGW